MHSIGEINVPAPRQMIDGMPYDGGFDSLGSSVHNSLEMGPSKHGSIWNKPEPSPPPRY